MTKDTVVAFRAPEGFSADPLTDLLRPGARQLIAQAVEAELSGFLAAHADQTDAAGRKRLVRHGHLPEKEGRLASEPCRLRCRASGNEEGQKTVRGDGFPDECTRGRTVEVHVDDPVALSAAC